MKILITGGLGFIGSHLVATLSNHHTIDIIDNFNEAYPGYQYIHRGNQGLQKINKIEQTENKIIFILVFIINLIDL